MEGDVHSAHMRALPTWAVRELDEISAAVPASTSHGRVSAEGYICIQGVDLPFPQGRVVRIRMLQHPRLVIHGIPR